MRPWAGASLLEDEVSTGLAMVHHEGLSYRVECLGIRCVMEVPPPAKSQHLRDARLYSKVLQKGREKRAEPTRRPGEAFFYQCK